MGHCFLSRFAKPNAYFGHRIHGRWSPTFGNFFSAGFGVVNRVLGIARFRLDHHQQAFTYNVYKYESQLLLTLRQTQ